MEESFLDASGSGVEISITAPSTNVSEDEEEFIPRALKKSNQVQDSSMDSNKHHRHDIIKGADGGAIINGEALEGDSLSKELDKKLSLVKENQISTSDGEHVSEENSGQELDEKPANLEMIGDRVLIERDGKFELVDVSEIKAEYFEMLGIDPQEKKAEMATMNSSETNGVANDDEKNKESPEQSEEKPQINKARPKTTNSNDYRQRKTIRSSSNSERRSTSAKLSSRNEDYAHIKSVYGMTEEQLKIKRRREEAVAKRKKEEKEREEEELRRKREDAERAFQAWLTAKIEEARERKKEEAKNKPDESIKVQRQLGAQQAYEEWLATKRQQNKIAREYEERRQSEEASQFIIRDRQLCDEAFRRWIRKKRADAKAKEKLKKKKKPKPKIKKKEPLPLNSKNITYLEYYGYRNNVVL